ncbi:hypothetical protein [Candidatus Amarolinea dominans]|uniref:hypothetical protein n=1 Tax=Candidatus Amarolinea dominans TaxID=3140696 RepID=UPI0031CCC36D
MNRSETVEAALHDDERGQQRQTQHAAPENGADALMRCSQAGRQILLTRLGRLERQVDLQPK